MTSEYLLKLASNASKLFESSEVHKKRLLLKMTLQNLELNGKIARYDWISPFDKIANLASRQLWLPQPWITIPENTFGSILQTFQNSNYVGEMRQRWNEIKKLQPSLAL